MTGEQFAELLAAARSGDEEAFARIWRDVNASVSRYLRVVAPSRAADVACETWGTVIRRLPDFEGGGTAWRSLVFTAARAQVELAQARRSWPDLPVEDAEPPAEDADVLAADADLLARGAASSAEGMLLEVALAALRSLPRHHGEALALGIVSGLPDEELARVLGSSVGAVRDLQSDGLLVLGMDRAVLARLLTAPATPEELADEPAAVATLRATRRRPPVVPTTRTAGAEARHVAGAHAGRRGAAAPKVLLLPSLAGRAAAVLATTTVVGFGAMSAAAYTGSLPPTLQGVMVEVIGASPSPAQQSASGDAESARSGGPGQPRRSSARGEGTSASADTGLPTAWPTSVATVAVLPGLCRAWAADVSLGVPVEESEAHRRLVVAAGDAAGVARLCSAETSAQPTVPLTVPAQPDPATGIVTPEPSTTTPSLPGETPGGTVTEPDPTTSEPGIPSTTEPAPETTTPTEPPAPETPDPTVPPTDEPTTTTDEPTTTTDEPAPRTDTPTPTTDEPAPTTDTPTPTTDQPTTGSAPADNAPGDGGTGDGGTGQEAGTSTGDGRDRNERDRDRRVRDRRDGDRQDRASRDRDKRDRENRDRDSRD